MRNLLLLTLLTACTSGTQESGDTSLSDTGAEILDSGDTGPVDVPDGTNGAVPTEALEAPEFAATNRDGGARDREDLLGHPTIMWFYPAAGTYG